MLSVRDACSMGAGKRLVTRKTIEKMTTAIEGTRNCSARVRFFPELTTAYSFSKHSRQSRSIPANSHSQLGHFAIFANSTALEWLHQEYGRPIWHPTPGS